MTQETGNREQDIRKLLRTFGVRADQVIQEHFKARQEVEELHLRIVLEELTEEAGGEVEPRQLLEIKGNVRRE